MGIFTENDDFCLCYREIELLQTKLDAALAELAELKSLSKRSRAFKLGQLDGQMRYEAERKFTK